MCVFFIKTMATCMGTETGCVLLALRQLLLSYYLLKHPSFNVVLAHALVCTGRGNSTPPFLFHSPCRGLINGVRPS